jgi:hypothetical protein
MSHHNNGKWDVTIFILKIKYCCGKPIPEIKV